MNILQLAGMLPRDPQFRAWVGTFVDGHPATQDQAEQFVRIVCKVDSRRQLATDRAAAERFHQFLRRPFCEWRQQQCQPA